MEYNRGRIKCPLYSWEYIRPIWRPTLNFLYMARTGREVEEGGGEE
jgi:hypothetical protein